MQHAIEQAARHFLAYPLHVGVVALASVCEITPVVAALREPERGRHRQSRSPTHADSAA